VLKTLGARLEHFLPKGHHALVTNAPLVTKYGTEFDSVGRVAKSDDAAISDFMLECLTAINFKVSIIFSLF